MTRSEARNASVTKIRGAERRGVAIILVTSLLVFVLTAYAHEVKGTDVVLAHEFVFVSARPAVEAEAEEEQNQSDNLGRSPPCCVAINVFLLVVSPSHEQSNAADD